VGTKQFLYVAQTVKPVFSDKQEKQCCFQYTQHDLTSFRCSATQLQQQQSTSALTIEFPQSASIKQKQIKGGFPSSFHRRVAQSGSQACLSSSISSLRPTSLCCQRKIEIW